MKFSIVVPLFNEQENIAELYKAIINALNRQVYDYEIVLVDDGSTDKSLEIIQKFYEDGETVNRASLVAKRIITARKVRGIIKIIGNTKSSRWMATCRMTPPIFPV